MKLETVGEAMKDIVLTALAIHAYTPLCTTQLETSKSMDVDTQKMLFVLKHTRISLNEQQLHASKAAKKANQILGVMKKS